MYQSAGATMWRLAMPALSKTPDRRSNRAFLPNASLASSLASDWATVCGGTAVATESRLQVCMQVLVSAGLPVLLQPVGMRSRLIQAALILALNACGGSPSATAQDSGAS